MAKIGPGTKIYDQTWIGPNVIIGEDCRIQAFAFIPDNVVIGNRVFVGPCTCFCNDKHPPSHGAWKEKEPTVVEDDVSIGANCTILPNITLGKGCVIGAGSVVTKSVKPEEVVYGNPARPKIDHIMGNFW
jgi:UDP-2-acetamido-3-amino-2,3-dideoxy-glucuronate N-acetyltransferase